MTKLTTTVFRVIAIGSKRYVIGLHPRESDPLLSIRRIGRRVTYIVTASRLRVEGALAYGRAEQAAKREARKMGVPWRSARKKFIANILPPTIRRKKNTFPPPARSG